ncbi:hypothetical protein G3N95_06810 [Paraburkholderia sp. Tr-20389]|uniref:hypothetical protein n=1 Tax=Paraburkholderia sp. Tr-20389 TaxID=2703903 RepID=UPI00197F6210|nr:hypothetical protein [Paraburkholderia sp. Tr-20389]MBN3752645.1 hypothetical protein [Paraburkholderia sp. Tr-20389]
MNTVSMARSATAAIFAAVAGIGYAQTGWLPATQSDKSMAVPGATSGELKTPRPSQSSASGMSGKATSDPGIPDTGRTRSIQRTHDRNKPATLPKAGQGETP